MQSVLNYGRVMAATLMAALVLCAVPTSLLMLSKGTSGKYDAVIVLGGGQLADFIPPPHVLLRLQRAAQMYHSAPPGRRPVIITTSRGTPHKPSPHDASGFEIDEADCQARFLMTNLSIPASAILEENMALDTIGNAYFTRLLHTDVDP